jgi:hypothetical protein
MSVYPRIFRLRQKRERPRIVDVAGEVERELAGLKLGSTIESGQSVAITAGSRGIANIHTITKAVVEHIQHLGAKPFLIPAMGSHGGGTAEGQRKVLESYGITEESIGCPIRATMETVVVCKTEEGIPVHFDRYAYEADHVLVCNRVKPHTAFSGEIESGLMKMMLIGLGKHAGATVYHQAIQDFSFQQIVHSVGEQVLSSCGVVAGLAIVENPYDETAKIAAVAPEGFIEREKELLLLAKEWMPRLPFKHVDILMIDEIGKNISGSCMDSNVTGRKLYGHDAGEDEYPKVKRIIVRGLTAETHGNATGIGTAEFCTTRALRQIDIEATRINCVTAGRPSAAMLPLNYDSDRELLDVSLPTIGLREPPEARLLWIRNTLDIAELECSAAYWEEAQQRDDLEILSDLLDFEFDPAGNFVPLNGLP